MSLSFYYKVKYSLSGNGSSTSSPAHANTLQVITYRLELMGDFRLIRSVLNCELSVNNGRMSRPSQFSSLELEFVCPIPYYEL